MGDGFGNDVVGGVGQLVRKFIQSIGFVSGSTGWRISRNGDAEFDNGVFRGEIVAGIPGGTRVEMTNQIPTELSTYWFGQGAVGITGGVILIWYDATNYYYILGVEIFPGIPDLVTGFGTTGGAVTEQPLFSRRNGFTVLEVDPGNNITVEPNTPGGPVAGDQIELNARQCNLNVTGSDLLYGTDSDMQWQNTPLPRLYAGGTADDTFIGNLVAGIVAETEIANLRTSIPFAQGRVYGVEFQGLVGATVTTDTYTINVYRGIFGAGGTIQIGTFSTGNAPLTQPMFRTIYRHTAANGIFDVSFTIQRRTGTGSFSVLGAPNNRINRTWVGIWDMGDQGQWRFI